MAERKRKRKREKEELKNQNAIGGVAGGISYLCGEKRLRDDVQQ